MSGDTSAPSHTEGTGRPVETTPLFRIDPGWPFVIAGLALIVSAVLIPAQRELHDLEQRLEVHRAYEARAQAEIVAYRQFMVDLANDSTNERLLERLVRAQLNKMPKDERPLLLMPTANETVPTWIESSVTVEIPKPTPYTDTLLSRIASGPRRLWVLATGAFLVFLGVMFAPTTFSSRRREETAPALDDAQSEWQDSAGGVATLEREDSDREDSEHAHAGTDDAAVEDAAATASEDTIEDESDDETDDEADDEAAASADPGIADSYAAVVSISASRATVEVDSVDSSDTSVESFSAEATASCRASIADEADGSGEVAAALSEIADASCVIAESGESADTVSGLVEPCVHDEDQDSVEMHAQAESSVAAISASPEVPALSEGTSDTLDDAAVDIEDDLGADVESASVDVISDEECVDEDAEQSAAEQIVETAVALAEPESERDSEPASVVEDEPPVCVIETYPSDFVATEAPETETLDRALGEIESHEAPDIHELEYDGTDLDAIDHPAGDDTDPGESIVSAETTEPPAEPEPIEERNVIPEATDRALDSTSLFAGLDDAQWIETRSGAPRGR